MEERPVCNTTHLQVLKQNLSLISLHLEFLSQLQSYRLLTDFFCFFSETKNVGSEVTATQDEGKFSMWVFLLICFLSSVCWPLSDGDTAGQSPHTYASLEFSLLWGYPRFSHPHESDRKHLSFYKPGQFTEMNDEESQASLCEDARVKLSLLISSSDLKIRSFYLH